MKTIILSAAAFILFAVAPASAEDWQYYRFKPLLIQRGDNMLVPPQVLIVDTKEGHIYLWEERYDRKSATEYATEATIKYQGRLRPGEKMGEVIEPAPAK